MTAFSPLGAETLLLPTVVSEGGGKALGVSEYPEGESLFASMVTGALASMHDDGVVQQPSSVVDIASLLVPSQTLATAGRVFNGEGDCAPKIEKTGPLVLGFKTSEAHAGLDSRPAFAPSPALRWGLRSGDRAIPKTADDSELPFFGGCPPQEDFNDEVASGESRLRISENGEIPTGPSVPGVPPLGVPPPGVAQVVIPVGESSSATGFSDGSKLSGALVPSGRISSPQTTHGNRPSPQGPFSGGNSSAPPAFLRQPAELVRAGLETPPALPTPIAVDATVRQTLAVSTRLQGQGREVGWQRVGSETPRNDPIGSTDSAPRGEWITRASPIPRSVGIDASTGEPSPAVAASMALFGESPSVPRVQVISGAGASLEEESARWGSAAAGRWLSLSSSEFTPETEAPVSEAASNEGFLSQADRADAERWASEFPPMNLQPASGQRPAVALSLVSGPEAAAREWLPSGFTRVSQPSADSWPDPRQVPVPVFRPMPAPPAQPGPEAVRPTPETALSKVTNFGEWAVPFMIADPASGSGGPSLETALSVLPEGAQETFAPELAAESKTTERTKNSPESTNLPPSRSADLAYGGSGGQTGKVLSDEGSSCQFFPDKTPEIPEKPVFQGQGTPSGKGGDPEAELSRNRSGMTHAGAQTAMASDRFQMSAPETAPQRRGAGPWEAESTGAVSVARVTESSMGMPLPDPLIRESNRLPEPPEAIALPQARSVTRLSDQLSGEVVLLQRLRTASMTAVLRPDAGSELRVDLRRREGRVEIRATLERGDAQAIAEGWPELQQQLRAQGVHLLPLEREVSPDSAKASSDLAEERSAQSGGRGRNQPPPQDPAPGAGGQMGQKPRSHQAQSTASSSAASKPDHRHLLESWA